MCLGGGPDIPPPPPQKDPILPKQPLQQTQPVGLSVGRTEEDDKVRQANKKRKGKGKLRIKPGKDTASAQVAGTTGKSGSAGVQV